MLQYEAICEDKARPGQTLKVAGGCDPRISRKSAHEGCQSYEPAAFSPQKIILVLISFRG